MRSQVAVAVAAQSALQGVAPRECSCTPEGFLVTARRALKSSARESSPPDRSGSLTLGSEKPRPPFAFHGSSAACR